MYHFLFYLALFSSAVSASVFALFHSLLCLLPSPSDLLPSTLRIFYLDCCNSTLGIAMLGIFSEASYEHINYSNEDKIVHHKPKCCNIRRIDALEKIRFKTNFEDGGLVWWADN